ncbi:MAG: protein kinase [Planctomycetes bacterium]|nr:protein kinase [Planctomycetota bacterium]MCW8136392.1 protein kinase [Planctomycetota bacterium]
MRAADSDSGGGKDRVYPVKTPDTGRTRKPAPAADPRRLPHQQPPQQGEETQRIPNIPTVSFDPPKPSPTPRTPQSPVRRVTSAPSNPRQGVIDSAPVVPPVGEATEIPSPEDLERAPAKPVEYAAAPDPTLAETQDMEPVEPEPPPPADSTARLSFGQAAVNLKLVTPAQIQECVNVQRALLAKGQRVPLLGQLLMQRGYLDKAGIERVKGYQQMYQIADKIPGYKLHEKLGQGAMGTVYKARQVRMERWVAIKILQPELAANATIKNRFLHESRASARLNHPNVITGIDAGEIEGLCYFAMEYVEGKTLQQLVKERGAMDERQALELIVQVAKALEHAEKLGLVHRDIKPDNIMVTRDRQVKLLDLGLAKVRADGEQGATKGMAVGTPNYISPEQAMGRQDIDTRSDIYSLGVTLYYCLTAKVPFEGPPEVVMYRHIHEPPPHPKNFRPDLGDATATLLHTMMAKRPEDRPASAMQLVSDMEHVLRTGKLPGFFDSQSGPLKVNKDSRIIGSKSGRMPNLRGYGMPPAQSGPAPAAPQPPAQPDAGQPRLPRKRKKRFGGSW